MLRVFNQIVRFVRQNRCTSRIVLCGNATSKLSATTTMTKRKKIKLKAEKAIGLIRKTKTENAAHFLADFFAVITQLTLSNLIGMGIV